MLSPFLQEISRLLVHVLWMINIAVIEFLPIQLDEKSSWERQGHVWKVSLCDLNIPGPIANGRKLNV